MMRSFLAACALCLLTDYTTQGYRIDRKKMMMSSVMNKIKTSKVDRDVLHAEATATQPQEKQSRLEHGNQESSLEAMNVSTIDTVDKQGANSSAKAKEWEPQGMLVKFGYLRSKAILHMASFVLPSSMMSHMPAMDAMKITDLPSTSGAPWFGIPFTSTAGMIIYSFVLIGAFTLAGIMIKFYSSLMAARAKPSVEGDDDNMVNCLGSIAGLALPMFVFGILVMINEITNTAILGHKASPAQLAALGLTQTLYNGGVVNIVLGLCSVMDTLVSQAHGHGNMELCVMYFQRCRLLSTIVLLVASPLFIFSEPILVLAGQDAEVAALTNIPAKLFFLTGLCWINSNTANIFLKNIGDMSRIVLFMLGNVIHVSCALLFVQYFDMGVVGIGLAMFCQSATVLVFMLHYIICTSGIKDFSLAQKVGFTVDCLPGLPEYLTLGIPAVFSMCCESWYGELQNLMVGWLGATALAANSSNGILIGTVLVVCGITGGAGTTLVARALGAGHVRQARMISFTVIVFIMLVWIVPLFLFSFCTDFFTRLFNSNPKVLELMRTMLRISAFTGCFQVAQIVSTSILRSMLRHRQVAIVQFFMYYLFALPLGYILAFKLDIGIFGVMNGYMVAMAVAGCGLTYLLANSDFEKASQESKSRMEVADLGKAQAEKAQATEKVGSSVD